jgi:hypothetical protein
MRRTLLAAICGLVLGWPLVAAGPVAASDPLGTVSAHNQVLKNGCHGYPFSYRVTPPPHTTTWSAEMFLIGPRGGKVGSAAFLSPADPTKGRSVFRMCRASMIPGKYTIRMKVTYIDIYDVHTETVKPTTFRITRR